jgi:predicted permease
VLLTQFNEALWQDMRYGFRLMVGAPCTTAIIVVTLALGIGANTAIFSVTNAVMFRRLPVQDPQNIVLLHWSANKVPKFTSYANYGDTRWLSIRTVSNPRGESFSHPFLEELEKAGIFSGVAAFAGGGKLTLSGDGLATTLDSQTVNGDFFPTLGIRPAVGRLLGPDDDKPSSAQVLVLSYACWQRVFGGSRSVVGMSMNLNGVPFTIVGVAEQKFASMSLGNVYDVWLPMAMQPQLDATFGPRQNDPAALWLLITARLKPGMSTAQQQAAVDVLFRNAVLHGAKPLLDSADAPRITLLRAQDALVGASDQFADPLRVLMIAVGILLLIACANVAGLLLSRATLRAHEVAVRLALGVSRSRLFLQMLIESLMLAAMGGALGCALAFWGARILVTMLASYRPRPLGVSVSIDWRAIAVTSAVSLLMGILFGSLPAVRGLRVDLTSALKRGARASADNSEARRHWYSTGSSLVILQSALAVVVMIGAGLLIHTLKNLRNLDPGFDSRNTLTFSLDPGHAGYKGPQIDNLYRELQQQIGATPGVTAVSYSLAPLLSRYWMRTSVKNLPPGSDPKSSVQLNVMPVGPGFFEAVRIPLLAGRPLNQADIEIPERPATSGTGYIKPGTATSAAPATSEPVIVNQTFARRFFPGRDVVGQHFGENDGGDPKLPVKSPGYVIVGLAQDAKYDTLRNDIQPTIYTPLQGQNAAFEVRTVADPKAMIPAIRDLITRDNPNIPMTNVLTQTEQIERLLDQERLVARLSGLFGVLALLLACIGLYGLLSYETTRRTSEIGIRMALGARRADIIRMVVSRGIALTAIGTALGLAIAIFAGHLLQSLLYQVKPADPATLISVTLLAALVASVATFIPARLATLVDPNITLRRE